jgi:protocatechuate 3,4-dioxygenase alpha subunit
LSDLSPFQPVGPYFHVMLRDEPRGHDTLVTADSRGERITIEGTLFDGAGAPMTDGFVEIWQADARGHFHHPADPAASDADPHFRGYGRTATDDTGRFQFDTVRPGAVAGPDGRPQAPHILVSVLAPGVLTRHVTRLYFGGDPAVERDAVLQLVPAARRATLIARPVGPGQYCFDIHLQGERETVFFDV